MYERSAIVLERYFDNIFSFNKQNNLRVNYQNYIDIITEAEEIMQPIPCGKALPQQKMPDGIRNAASQGITCQDWNQSPVISFVEGLCGL